jgi:hypothetical protein
MAGKLRPDAFEFYFGLGPGRSYQAVARRYGVSKRSVTKHAQGEGWQGRLEEIERKARQANDRKAVESLEAINERHLRSLRVIQGKALEALRANPLRSGMEAVRALEVGIRLERVVAGLDAPREEGGAGSPEDPEAQVALAKDLLNLLLPPWQKDAYCYVSSLEEICVARANFDAFMADFLRSHPEVTVEQFRDEDHTEELLQWTEDRVCQDLEEERKGKKT